MDKSFLTEIKIVKVRQLRDQSIELSKSDRKNLIITGKNGCGKTSVLMGLAAFLKYMVSDDYEPDNTEEQIALRKAELAACWDASQRASHHQFIKFTEKYARRRWNDGCIAWENTRKGIQEKYRQGRFILAFYPDNRRMDIDPYREVVRMDVKQVYDIEEHPAKSIGKYLANLKFAEALAAMNNDTERQEGIKNWFNQFEAVLQKIYDNDQLKLEFDTETFQFSIRLSKNHSFALDCMSMGYAAVFDIVGDLMMRMSPWHVQDIEGIVLIDEVETHLHVALQKQIVPILTTLFPNIQFILTSHSPFVLSSAENAVIYDLEIKYRHPDGMTLLPYEAIVEGHFDTSRLSRVLWDLFGQYKKALADHESGDANDRTLRDLEKQLDSVPEFLSQDFVYEYQSLRLDHGR